LRAVVKAGRRRITLRKDPEHAGTSCCLKIDLKAEPTGKLDQCVPCSQGFDPGRYDGGSFMANRERLEFCGAAWSRRGSLMVANWNEAGLDGLLGPTSRGCKILGKVSAVTSDHGKSKPQIMCNQDTCSVGMVQEREAFWRRKSCGRVHGAHFAWALRRQICLDRKK